MSDVNIQPTNNLKIKIKNSPADCSLQKSRYIFYKEKRLQVTFIKFPRPTAIAHNTQNVKNKQYTPVQSVILDLGKTLEKTQTQYKYYYNDGYIINIKI